MARDASGNELVAVVNPDGTTVGSSPGTGTSATQTQGTAADNAAAVGNPVMMAGKYYSAVQTYANGDVAVFQSDINGYVKSVEQYVPVYEDNTNGKAIIEHRYTYSMVTADTLVKTGAGFLHTVTFSPNDAAPTAGTIAILDATSAGGTPVIHQVGFTTTWFAPVTIFINSTFANGLYVDFTTTADVNVTVAYR